MTPALAIALAAIVAAQADTLPASVERMASVGWGGVIVRPAAVTFVVSGTAPEFKSDGCCCADSTRPSRVGAVVLYAVGQRAPAWRPGCWAIPGCMDSVRVQAAPVQEQSVGVVGGQRFSFVVPVDSLSRFVLSRWPLGGDPNGPWGTSVCWGRVVRP